MNQGSIRAQQLAIAAVERELAELDAATLRLDDVPEPGDGGRSSAPHGGASPSVVFSVRLDRDDVTILRRRARLMGLPPTVLARNLIRVGLARPDSAAVSGAVGRVAQAVADLQARVS